MTYYSVKNILKGVVVMRKCPRCGSQLASKVTHTAYGTRLSYSCQCGYRSEDPAPVRLGNPSVSDPKTGHQISRNSTEILSRKQVDYAVACPRCKTSMTSYIQTLYGVTQKIYVCPNCNYSVSAGITTGGI